MPETFKMDEITLDFLLVADGAQSVNGKLYVLGGGWTHLWLPQFPGRAPIPFALALGLRVPWSRTNQRFAFALELRDADNERVGEEPIAHGEFEQGRPPGLRPGTEQRIVMAIPVGAEFPAAGRYGFSLQIDDREIGNTWIEVNQAQQAPSPA
jgi:hypothetical protein